MILLDATHTSHTRAQTGIQRVVRSLFRELEKRGRAAPICFDPHEHAWRGLTAEELATLRDHGGGSGSRGAKWTLAQKLAGRARRLLGRRGALPAAQGLVVPELFSVKVAGELPGLRAQVRGPRVAVFHDAIGLKFPELTPPATVARLPGYLVELAQFDGVAAVSEDSAASLRDFWRWADVRRTPPVCAIPNGVDPVPASALGAARDGPPRVLCVSTIEGRKNHLALLEAAETLWREGRDFELELIGLARADTAAPALARIAALRESGRKIVHHGPVSDEKLHAAYARCAFTVYPSLIEGFGLPVLESLQHGRPCICSGHGALGEAARGGGALTLEATNAANLASAMHQLLLDASLAKDLAMQARARKFRSWSDYAGELVAWMDSLPRRD
ncbi:MAG: glycosyltransferase family 4 protein [Candidatus Didemnitutus sp.]|nr:glycosyltransferase family 4 protein [Candidatus Didemnitutus sp.]